MLWREFIKLTCEALNDDDKDIKHEHKHKSIMILINVT
jgi:hypothetical protein